MSRKPTFHLSNFGRSFCLHFDVEFAKLFRDLVEKYGEHVEGADEDEVLHALLTKFDQHMNYVVGPRG